MTAMPAMMNTIFPALGLGIIKGILIRFSNHNWQSAKTVSVLYTTLIACPPSCQLPNVTNVTATLTFSTQSTVEAAKEGEEKVLCSSTSLLWLPCESCHLLYKIFFYQFQDNSYVDPYAGYDHHARLAMET